MSKLKEIARKTCGAGGLSAGREYINMNDLIAAYPEGVSINGLEMASNPETGAMYPTFSYKEDAGRYFTGGKALSELADAWLSEYTDPARLNRELAKEPVKVKLTKCNTKKGKTYIKVSVVDDDDIDMPF